MSGKLAIMAGLAITFGATSYYAGNEYLDSQAQARLNQIESGNAVNAAALTSIVVATKSFQFGESISAEDLKLVSWPKDAMPEGTYSTIEEAVGNGERKAIKSIEANEPVLSLKLTGENGRAGLAGIISEGMRAVTIPVDNVKGVGGFVQPGDRVDIVFTQRDRKTGEQTAKIIMEAIKVLSVDQQAGSRSDAPKVAKTVTLETNSDGAQQLALASDVGRLSLLLRGAGDELAGGTSSISFGGAGFDETDEVENEQDPDNGILSFLTSKGKEPSQTVIKVVRGEDVHENVVPVQSQIKLKN
ncbi:MAG: Flp pilus assembly protein CpaB [Salaquimonas sp.]